MSFNVGQKVERIGGRAATAGLNYPPMHTPCTVANVFETPDGTIQIELVEFPQPDTPSHYAGFKSQFFRPITEKKTDIAIFTQMLRPEPNAPVRGKKPAKVHEHQSAAYRTHPVGA